MEIIEKTAQAATLKFTSREFAMLAAILSVFEYKMEQQQIDYEMLMETPEAAQQFISDFDALFLR